MAGDDFEFTPAMEDAGWKATDDLYGMLTEARMPHRNDATEAWIKRHRDEYRPGYSDWHALDHLLDDYRMHADTGTPLLLDVDDPNEARS